MVFSLIGSCNCVSIILIAGTKEVKHESVLYSSARLIFPNTVSQVTYNDSLSSTLQHLNVGVFLVKTACNLCLLFLANIIYYYLLQGTVFQPDFLFISPQYQATMIMLPSMSAMPLFILLPSASSSFYHHTPLTFSLSLSFILFLLLLSPILYKQYLMMYSTYLSLIIHHTKFSILFPVSGLANQAIICS